MAENALFCASQPLVDTRSDWRWKDGYYTGRQEALAEVEAVGTDALKRLPYRLRDEAPALARCSDCGRQSRNVSEVGRPCAMLQLTGVRCLGTMIGDIEALVTWVTALQAESEGQG